MSTATPEAAARFDRRAIAALLAFTITSRLVYIPGAVMGFDGPAYINSLKLDRTFNVPMPGNIGYVLLGKLFTLVYPDPVVAFALVGTLLSAVAAAYGYLFAALVLPRRMALPTAFALITSPMAWYHGVIMQSYVVWLAALPAIGYYGLRLVREGTWRMLLSASLATGLSTILRPDLVAFGGPLLGACMFIAWHRTGFARRALGWWPAAAAVCGACCCVWFYTTAHILGGVDTYLAMIRGKHEWHEHFGVGAKGLFEGLARNVVKYGLFMLWAAHAALPLAAIGGLVYLRRAGIHWRGWLIGLEWVAPSLWFSWVIFMGNAGLIFPALPLVYLAAAAGTLALFRGRRGAMASAAAEPDRAVHRASVAMALLAALNTVLFTLTPILPLTDQRAALLNHMFFGYSGRGIRRIYTHQLEDFGIDRSLKNTVRQFADPQPLPKAPPGVP